MLCPKCGALNQNGTQICSWCTADLTALPPPKPKTSKVAIASALLAVLAAAMLFFVHPTFAFLVALLALGTAIAAIVKVLKSNRRLTGKSLAIVATVYSSIQMLSLILWSIDAPPVPGDYTMADVTSAEAEYDETFLFLTALADVDQNIPDSHPLGLSGQEIRKMEKVDDLFAKHEYCQVADALDANAVNIMLLWMNAKKGRDIISELDDFPQIADLTEPNLGPDVPFLKNLRHIAQL